MAAASETLIGAANRALGLLRARPMLVDVGVAVLVAVLALSELTGDDITAGRDPDLFGVMLVLAAIGWFMGRGIVRPIVMMVGTMRELADGNNSVEISGRDRGDEIGAMAKAVHCRGVR